MTMLVAPPADLYVEAMSGDDLDLLRQLLAQWQDKLRRNLLRRSYYDGKNRLRDMGISIPPGLDAIETVVGWPAKAVTALAQRVVFEGFVLPGTDDPYDLDAILSDNASSVEFPQAFTSALIHSVSMLAITQGDVAAGEPEVLIQPVSAINATALWDRRRRALSAALVVSDADENANPTEMVMLLPDRIGVCARRAGGGWSVTWRFHSLGRVPVEPLVYRPDLDRPFGRSRISRPVMSITDEAVRTVLRTEVSAEFYTSPQRYVLGADEDPFVDGSGQPVPRWQAILGRVWGISRDEDGNAPTVGQFPQMTMQPHTDHLRSIAARFASETSLPLSSLGIVQDNPSSAEAIYAAKEDLVIEAKDTAAMFGGSLVRAARTAVMLRDGLTEPPADSKALQAKWANPATPSVVSAADAAVKFVAAVPDLAESTVILEQMGFSQPDITRIVADRRRARGASVLERALAASVTEPDGDEG